MRRRADVTIIPIGPYTVGQVLTRVEFRGGDAPSTHVGILIYGGPAAMDPSTFGYIAEGDSDPNGRADIRADVILGLASCLRSDRKVTVRASW